MAGKSDEKLIQPLKDICLKIETEVNIQQHVSDLKKYFNKGGFYECHCFIELLEVLSRNPKLPEAKTSEVFKLLDALLHDGDKNKDAILGRFYNFIRVNEVGAIKLLLLLHLSDFLHF